MAEAKNIMTFEQMQKLLDSAEQQPKKAKSSSTKKKSRSPKPPAITNEVTPESGDDYAYFDIHFWLRPNDSWQTLLNDAKSERQFRGPNVVVFAHNHTRTSECVPTCREIV